MTKSELIKMFDERTIRSVWADELEKCFFSIVDVVAVLTDSANPRKYWSALKTRLKMTSSDGKKYKTDCGTTAQIFRLIQSIPSPKAEPFNFQG